MDMTQQLKATLLGTGSPRPNLVRSQPAVLVAWGNEKVLVDCGDGTVQQLQHAGLNPNEIHNVFFTHLHWDHVLGYPSLVWGGWSLGRDRLAVWGPPGTGRMHAELVRNFFTEQAEWVREEIGYNTAGWENISIAELSDGEIVTIGDCQVRAQHVLHPPIEAFAMRFEYDDRSLVISGDVARCEELVDIARDADVLVIDVCATAPSFGSSFSQEMLDNLRVSHASARDAGIMATEANVGRVICTHLLPGVDTSFVIEEVRRHYHGRVEVGEDLTAYEV